VKLGNEFLLRYDNRLISIYMESCYLYGNPAYLEKRDTEESFEKVNNIQ